MTQDNLIFAAAIAGALWLMFRVRPKDGSRIGLFGRSRASRPGAAASGQSTMPRVGTPGTITPDQIKALEHCNFTPDKKWSREEADLILDTVAYLRAVSAEAIGQAEPPLEVQNALLRTILTDQDLRDYVRAWGERRRAAGEAHEEPVLAHNQQFERVAQAARELTGRADEGNGG